MFVGDDDAGIKKIDGISYVDLECRVGDKSNGSLLHIIYRLFDRLDSPL